MPIRKRGSDGGGFKVKRPPVPKTAALPDDAAPVLTDEELIAGIRTLSRPDKGGLQIHVWPRKAGGFQANVLVKNDGPGWAVYMGHNPITALKRAIAAKLR